MFNKIKNIVDFDVAIEEGVVLLACPTEDSSIKNMVVTSNEEVIRAYAPDAARLKESADENDENDEGGECRSVCNLLTGEFLTVHPEIFDGVASCIGMVNAYEHDYVAAGVAPDEKYNCDSLVAVECVYSVFANEDDVVMVSKQALPFVDKSKSSLEFKVLAYIQGEKIDYVRLLAPQESK